MTIRRYTLEEDEIIRNMKRNEIKEIAKRLGRSQCAIGQRRSILLNPPENPRPHKPLPRKSRTVIEGRPFSRPDWFNENIVELATSARN